MGFETNSKSLHIVKRWTREAKDMVVHDMNGKMVEANAKMNIYELYKKVDWFSKQFAVLVQMMIIQVF